MILYMVGKLAPTSIHFTTGLVTYTPRRDYFRAVPSQNRNKVTTSPTPQSLNDSVGEEGWVDHVDGVQEIEILSVPIALRSVELPSSSLPSAPRSMAFPNNRSPLTSDHLEPPWTACPYLGTVYSKPA